MNVKNFKVFALAICSVLVFSCKENENEVIIQEQGKLEFSFADLSASNQRIQKDSASFVLVSIEDTKGNSVLNRKKVELYYFNGQILSEPISLNTGSYFLTEYLVLDDQENVIYAAPKKEAKLNYLVETPLPIEFIIKKDHTEKVVPTVVPTNGINPIDFGYTTFSFDIVHTFHFMISVFTYDATSNNFQLTDSKLQVKHNNDVLYDGDITDSTNQVIMIDGYNSYKLTVFKEGYAAYQGEFSANELKGYGSEPLIIKLFSGVNIDSGLLAFYPLNGNAKDAGKYQYDGLIHEAIPANDRHEIAASAYHFDGEDDKIAMGDVLDFQSSDFTISFWVKIDTFKGKIPNTNSYGSWIVSKGITIFGTPKRAGYAVNAYKSIEGKNYFQFFLGSQQEQIFMIEKDGFSESEWYHVVVMKHGLKQKLYVNSELVADADLPNAFNVDTNISLVLGSMDKLGNDAYGTTYLKGALDDVRFHERALSIEEIAFLYND